MPTRFQGVPFRSQGDPVLDVGNPKGVDARLQRDSIDLINELNLHHHEAHGDPEILTRINAYEMAYRMQTSAPELMDLSKESPQTLAMYGAEQGKPSPISPLGNLAIDPLFEGAAEATEEAIVNALVAARTMTGINGTRVYGIPHDELRSILKRYNRLEASR